mgnify:FL=1
MKYEQWILRREGRAAGRPLLESAGLPALCAAVLCARGLDTPQAARAFLASGPELLHDPFLMRDMDRAAARITRALNAGETIAVYGDYDVDGITATCLLTEFLRGLGGRVVSYIPDRMEEGYGLNREAIAQLARDGVSLIVTVDCGITAVSEVAYARTLGLDIVITDHHRCKDILPDACAVVDPRRSDCPYPFPELAGVGVALKLALALTPESGRQAVLLRYAELAAIGTVADVMSLTGENRAIVTLGLARLPHTRRPGLRALLGEVAPNQSVYTAVTISYGLAPRINAAGRMEQVGVALSLLLTRDEERARALAQTLCALNRERQAREGEILEQCLACLSQPGSAPKGAIVLAGEGWHQGVVGIVASRLSEQFHRPAFMICLDHGRGKGSCRSFGGFNLFAALERCAPLLEEYGGHELAAGFTILEENIPAFRARMEALVAEYTAGSPMTSAIRIDVDADAALLTCAQVEALSILGPFGAGNPKPVLRLRSALVLSCADVGGGRHMKLRVRRGEHMFDAIFFSVSCAAAGISPGDRVDLVFTPEVNEFRGRRELQLQLCDLRPALTRTQVEQALVERLYANAPLTAQEAAMLLPERDDFAGMWRFLKRLCAQGPATVPIEQLVLSATRTCAARRSYGKAMVCLMVLDERGLITVDRTRRSASISLRTPEKKVDLTQSQWLRRLQEFLEQ